MIACTTAPAPSLNADAQAKQFAPDPTALTVYVVRRNWGDGRHLVKVQADGGATVETLPDTMVRYKLKPGTHAITFDFEGQRPARTVEGKAGEVRFVRLDGMGLGLEEHVHLGHRSRGRNTRKGAEGQAHRRLEGALKVAAVRSAANVGGE